MLTIAGGIILAYVGSMIFLMLLPFLFRLVLILGPIALCLTAFVWLAHG